MTDMTLSDDQGMLADSARRYVERAYDAAVRERSMLDGHGCLKEVWQAFAGMGWLAMALPESADGLGASVLDLCLVAEELGRAPVNEPWIAASVFAAPLLAACADDELRREWLPGLIDGTRRIAFVPWTHGTVLRKENSVEVLEGGGGALVIGGSGADAYIVEASPQEGRRALLLVRADQAGVTIDACALYDGRGAARLRFSGVEATCLRSDTREAIAACVEVVVQQATVAHCAETVGSMQRAFEITLEYLKTRRQFGGSIAANQVVQHRLVDLMIEIEEARALTHAAARSLDDDAATDAARRRMVSGAASCVSSAARLVWKECVQLHGAIGMTQEYELGQFVRRLAAAATLHGGAASHLEALAALSLDEEGIPA
ncbi:acyl-CoA dehydrogenase family protein [Variovorax sp. Sphag1AA]|uniref:acyl-CoA dehydrogenase family protein n=1 Tax=Variovorax sp. Sphag1AA TaxID=2587027 RepID=UPI001615F83B|nr:acyl-CoA dehydrogenase [Variovorax sp. Sphag1AA]MBB3181423.1 butyryl-CoA dehydrogenase [Variovorax sp. Sphag1AA]